MNFLRRNLKVCEGCGGLFVRTNGSSPYCRYCTPRMAEAPKQSGRLRVVMASEEPAERVVFLKRVPADLPTYRAYTEALLRRYGVLSMQCGKTPSIDMQTMFRGKASHRSVVRFDDVVNFVHDMESCIKALSPCQQRMLLRIGVQEYTLAEAAHMFRISLRTTTKRYYTAVDALTAVLLDRGLLERVESLQTQSRAA